MNTPVNSPSGSRLRTSLALLASLVMWASAFVGIRATLPVFSPGGLALGRFLVGSIALLALWVLNRQVTGGAIRLPARRDVPIIVIGSFAVVFVYNVALNIGEKTVTAGTASFIVGQVPLFSIVLAAIFLGEHLRRSAWFGVLLGVIGTVLLLFADSAGPSVSIGALWVLVAAAAEGVYFVLSKGLLQRYSAIELQVYITVPGTLMMMPFLPELVRDIPAASAGELLTVAYLGVGPAALAYVLWNYAMARLSVTTTTASLYTLPLITTVVGFVLLREMPEPLGFLGGAIGLLGAVVVHLRTRTSESSAQDRDRSTSTAPTNAGTTADGTLGSN